MCPTLAQCHGGTLFMSHRRTWKTRTDLFLL
jgi:hypothetical protein